MFPSRRITFFGRSSWLKQSALVREFFDPRVARDPYKLQDALRSKRNLPIESLWRPWSLLNLPQARLLLTFMVAQDRAPHARA